MDGQGTVLGGRYRLLDVLGNGGMARVYRAEDERLHRVVAVKVLHPQYHGQAEFVRRFEQEAQLAAALAHPNIVAIYDMGRDDGSYYIVMEYVEGSSLKALIAREAPLPLGRTIPIMRQLGQALDFAHARGVIHRDVKPENILLTATDIVKVSDFGIARALTTSGQTATGIVLGSVSYFSPEQAQGRPATAESDIYSSGIVLYEMLTGRVPFVADNPLATAMQHITQQPTPPRTLVPALPPAVDPVVLKALSKAPAARFHSGAALAAALDAAAQAPLPQPQAAPAAAPAPGWAATPRPLSQAPTARMPRVSRAGLAPARRRAPVFPLLLLVLVGGGAAYAATHSGLGALFAGTSQPTPTPTTLPGTTPTTLPGTTPTTLPATSTRVVAGPAPTTAAAATTPTSPAAPANFTPTSAARPTATAPAGSSPTPRATPSTPPSPTPPSSPTPAQTHTPVPTRTAAPAAGHVAADVVTARGHAFDGSGTVIPIDPRDTFAANVGVVYAIIHFHHLPRDARVAARWTFPGGRTASNGLPNAYASAFAYEQIAGAGAYTVAVVVNGKVVGAHHFRVTAAKGAGPTSGGGSQGASPGSQPRVFFASATGKHRHKGHGTGHGNGQGGHGQGQTDEGG